MLAVGSVLCAYLLEVNSSLRAHWVIGLAVTLRMQIGGLMTNLTQEYTNFLNFLTTTPSSIQTLINDAKLLNAQLNAVGLRASPLAEFSLLCFPRMAVCGR